MNRLIFVGLFALLPTILLAHEPQRSYISLAKLDTEPVAEIRLDLRDINLIVQLDSDLDGSVQAQELTQSIPQITGYLERAVQITGATACILKNPIIHIANTIYRDELIATYNLNCRFTTGQVALASTLFANVSPDHRSFVSVQTGRDVLSTILDGSGNAAILHLEHSDGGFVVWDYFKLGLIHLIEGIDHIFFLIVLVQPIFFKYMGIKLRLLALIAPVTGFTLGHAITLTATLTDLIHPPIAVIEVLIALSIAIIGFINIIPRFSKDYDAASSFFGTIHGFGFASALGSVNLSGFTFGQAILGFNLGLEVGQIAIVGVLVLVFGIVMQNRLAYFAISGAIAVISSVWVADRLAAL